MSDDEKREMKDQLNRIERCLTGDAEMGQLGLVGRMNNHAGRIKRLEQWVFYYGACGAGGAATIALIYKVLTDWLPHWLPH